MRTGLSTIQQTLTAEAAAVLNRSIAEASRRSHGQTTPLHVAATLLAAPSGLLRQACIRSHPNSSHPLQCRALELCFSVALDRLPSINPTPSNTSNSNTSTSCSATADPPISNALLAALKRAQAHQRRGCPEQQQQPLLAVKVELEQLVVSILDDPSVSRVMREASFSSPAVKATIEQSLANITSTPTSSPINLPQRSISSNLYINPRLQQGSGAADPARKDDAQRGNLYINPRLQQGSGAVDTARKDDAQRVLDIMVRTKKRNPVIVTDSDPAKLMREVLERIEAGDAPAPLRGAHVISLEKEFTEISDRSRISSQIKELGGLIEARIGDGSGRGVVVDAGDLKWLVENPAGSMGSGQIQQQQIVSEAGRAAVVEMTKVLQRFGDGGRVWLLGTATCPTYLRCQVYHPAMDNDWDLQALPIAPRSTVPSLLPRNSGINGILSSSVESLAPTKGFPALCTTMSPLRRPLESTDTSRKTTLCPVCMENYERELASLVAKEFEKSSSDLMPETRQALPHWLKPASNKSPAEPHQAQEVLWKQSTEELLKRWRDTCSRLHPTSNPLLAGREHRPALAFPVPSLHNPSTFPPRTTLQTRLTLSRSTDPASNHQSRLLHMSNQRPRTPPRSPVKTDLVLGHPKAFDSALEKAHRDRLKDSTGCKPDRLSDNRGDKAAGVSDMDSFKRLYKGLVEKVEWQPEAASAVATMVMQCKAGNGKSRGAGPKGDSWLLFIGSDKVGKRKMAASLSELVFGAVPVIVNMGSSSGTIGNYREEAPRLRGRTSLDQVSEAIRRNPFSVVVLEGIDSADMLVRESIKRAIEKGRLLDSQGREVSLGSVIFVLDSDWLPEELRRANDSLLQCEERILSSANCGWELEISVGDSSRKHGSECEYGDNRPTKLRKGLSGGPALSLDLNLAIGVSDDTGEGSRNSSDLTVEHEQESVRLAINCAAVSPASELIELVDCAIEFKPVDFSPMRRSVLESIYAKFSAVLGRGRLIQVDEDALDRIVGSLWLTGAPATDGFDEWADKVLVPSIKQLYSNVTSGDGLATVRLSAVKSVQRRWTGSLPPAVAIAVDGLPRHDRYI